MAYGSKRCRQEQVSTVSGTKTVSLCIILTAAAPRAIYSPQSGRSVGVRPIVGCTHYLMMPPVRARKPCPSPRPQVHDRRSYSLPQLPFALQQPGMKPFTAHSWLEFWFYGLYPVCMITLSALGIFGTLALWPFRPKQTPQSCQTCR